MGNICCGGNEEKKPSILVDSNNSDVTDRIGTSSEQLDYDNIKNKNSISDPTFNNNNNDVTGGGLLGQQQQQINNINDVTSSEQNAAATKLAAEEEQARMMIVQATGRAMVAVRSTRGSTGYYDQGFAAALAQHLEQTTTFSNTVPAILPESSTTKSTSTSTSSTLLSRLSQPEWAGIALGNTDDGSLAGCAGENPLTYFDHIAEQFLDQSIPKKERIFANVQPITDNLL